MKLLADENMDASVIAGLRKAGHEVITRNSEDQKDRLADPPAGHGAFASAKCQRE